MRLTAYVLECFHTHRTKAEQKKCLNFLIRQVLICNCRLYAVGRLIKQREVVSVKELTDLASKINSGKRVVINHLWRLGDSFGIKIYVVSTSAGRSDIDGIFLKNIGKTGPASIKYSINIL